METLKSRDGADAAERTPSKQATPVSSSSTPPDAFVSTAFDLALLIDGAAPDLLIVTSDTVNFHVHTAIILRLSTNAFYGMLLPAISTIAVAETAAVINVVLHVFYGRSCTEYKPTFEDIDASVTALVKYGASLSELAVSPLPLFDLLVTQARLRAIDVYAVAGQNALEEVAVAASAYLISYNPLHLTDELSVKMGPVYLKSLMNLHFYRRMALKAVVLTPPGKHLPTATCDDATQTRVLTAWAVVAAQLVWTASPDISSNALQAAFGKANTSITCPDCRARLQVRIHDMAREWSAVKRTI
ncbi:hypothetical protein K466DRAFT_602011 [Polyporus arcularius HHB13444]|uniref:BTB domain-containing protein n=1 Tax=Polyporus arcularius HHB13444 TaxID=1314778 RepID=A0A5C3P453_9APHY|nr:hypothetical protein K466DRAFT_602011 [Polyporus arcularius HHB13444]